LYIFVRCVVTSKSERQKSFRILCVLYLSFFITMIIIGYIMKNLTVISTNRWYHENMSRIDAENALMRIPRDGCFLVRKCRPDERNVIAYAISFRSVDYCIIISVMLMKQIYLPAQFVMTTFCRSQNLVRICKNDFSCSIVISQLNSLLFLTCNICYINLKLCLPICEICCENFQLFRSLVYFVYWSAKLFVPKKVFTSWSGSYAKAGEKT